MKTLLLLAVAGLLTVLPAKADVPVPADPFGDAMVLQRDAKVPVFGKAAPGAQVTVSFAGQRRETIADKDGAWRVVLDPMPASAEGRVMTLASGADQREIKDVLVGEVWICSGQSNMEFTVAKSSTAKDDATAEDPELRLRTVAKTPAETPQTALRGTPWLHADARSIPGFSAVGYAFGARLRAELKVPVGLVCSSWGGTRIEAWTPADSKPQAPSPSDKNRHQQLAVLYNGMIHPLAGCAIRGAIWYQGESNCIQGDGLTYADRMRALVSGWRQAFGDIPFYFTQIAPYDYGRNKVQNPADALFALWQGQAKAALEIPKVGMAHTQDVGNWHDIHPTSKRPVGERLARLALARTYGVTFKDDTGPVFRAITVTNGNATLKFDHAKSGLMAQDGKSLAGFEVAGPDGAFVPAEAKIVDETVVVSAPQVEQVARIRFGWQTGVTTNLANGEGLPACAFEAAAK